MPGVIRKRGKKFVLKLYTGREGGKKRTRWYTFTTRTEAESLQRELATHTLAHSAGVGFYGSPRERLGSYLKDWLPRQKARLAPKTFARYGDFAKTIQRDAIATVLLARLTPQNFDAFYSRLETVGLSSTTRNHVHRFLRKALQDAFVRQQILKNPVSLAVAPKRSTRRPEPWTEAQVLLFLTEADSSRYFPLYLFTADAGTRLAEAMGLRWRDVNLREGTVHIVQTLQRLQGGGVYVKGPKTEHGYRTIALSEQTVEALRDLHRKQSAERLQRGGVCQKDAQCTAQACPLWHDLGLVFTQANGKPLHANNIRQRDLRHICTKLGLPWSHALHNLRHYMASYLLAQGANPKVVQARGGWQSEAFFMRHYAHVMPGGQEQVAQTMTAMFSGLRRKVEGRG